MAADEQKPKMRSILVDNVRYRTIFTKKFAERKPYEEPDPKVIKAFIPGTIKKVFVKRRRKVEQGEELFILDAMKMENVIRAPMDGVIKDLLVKPGQAIAKGDTLLILK